MSFERLVNRHQRALNNTAPPPPTGNVVPPRAGLREVLGGDTPAALAGRFIAHMQEHGNAGADIVSYKGPGGEKAAVNAYPVGIAGQANFIDKSRIQSRVPYLSVPNFEQVVLDQNIFDPKDFDEQSVITGAAINAARPFDWIDLNHHIRSGFKEVFLCADGVLRFRDGKEVTLGQGERFFSGVLHGKKKKMGGSRSHLENHDRFYSIQLRDLLPAIAHEKIQKASQPAHRVVQQGAGSAAVKKLFKFKKIN